MFFTFFLSDTILADILARVGEILLILVKNNVILCYTYISKSFTLTTLPKVPSPRVPSILSEMQHQDLLVIIND